MRVKRWVKNSEEKIIDCFKNVLGVFSTTGSNNVSLIIRRTPTMVDMFFAICNVGENNNSFSRISCNLMISSLEGNFNGSLFEKTDSKENVIFDGFEINSIANVCGIPSEKSEDFVTQGIEKLLEGVVPKKDDESYILVILAEPLTTATTRDILNGYEEIATSLTPFVTNQFQYSKNDGESNGTSDAVTATKTVSDAITKTHSVNVSVNVGGYIGPVKLGGSVGYGYSHGKTHTEADSDSSMKGSNYMLTKGTGESSIYTYKSYPVANLVEKAEKTIKRVQIGQSNGLWRYASYVLSPKSSVSKNIAGYISAVSQGDESYIELPVVVEWSKYKKQSSKDENERKINEKKESESINFSRLLDYIKHFTHPVFFNREDKILITPTAYLSTSELSVLYAFPKNSMQGLPVIECTRFGREPHSLIELKQDIEIGCAYHMHTHEDKNRIFLGKDELTKHTFITGSTGSGKSNTIFKLIEQLCPVNSINTHFLVIEPAKGEYKDVFGGRKDVTVYGTNPYKVPNLLQINPFSFPNDIHVLEHIDRLVEVFNACWPMYAAMPAILKESIEKTYEECGWNLRTSKNLGKFPTFNDLLEMLPKVVESSEYSKDTSSDYKGALVTRVRSLTRGIHGQIFAYDISCDELFDKNAIIDLSRVGSSETKALIMGILVLKLQEYRMSNANGSNNKLKHVTILEEAHNLLRRTSSEQSQESSNLQGKSVEMLANSIAEMRTYGEGFIITDQSPGLMDMAVIRNTNTKIIMRLPDESDRRLVGKSAGLNDSQVEEISRLEQGVAAISQSDWLEPVLCKIDYFGEKKPIKARFTSDTFEWIDEENKSIQQFLFNAFGVKCVKLTPDNIENIRKWYSGLGLSEKARYIFENIVEGNIINDVEKMLLIRYVIGEKLERIISRNDAIYEVKNSLFSKYNIENDEVIRQISELFAVHFPLNTIVENLQTEKLRRGEGNLS